MGELIVVLVVLAAAGIGGASVVGARRRNITGRPVPTLGIHDEAAIAARAGQYYRLCQRAIRLLEELQKDVTVSGFLSKEQRQAAQQIIDDFYA